MTASPVAHAEPVAAVPKDITKEELDALIAVAAKLDESASVTHSGVPPTDKGGESYADGHVVESHTQTANTEPPQGPDLGVNLPHSITREELDALSAVAARLNDSNPGNLPTEEFEHLHAPGIAPVPVKTEETLMTFGQVDAGVPVHAEAPVAEVADPVNTAQFAEQPAPVDRNDEPMFVSAVAEQVPAGPPPSESFNVRAQEPEAQTQAETAEFIPVQPSSSSDAPVHGTASEDETTAPSDDELAEALRLLTPSSGHTTTPCDATDHAGPHWAAEAVSLTAEEAGMSLEAEMFRTFAPIPTTEADASPATDRESTIRAAVEDGLARAAKQAEAAAEQAPKAMAVAAAAESSMSASDETDIANIVDRVLADLRPKIVEEIAKKLGKK